MPDHRPISEAELVNIEAAFAIGRRTLKQLCENSTRRFTMTIPAQADDDDIVFDHVLRAGVRATTEIRRLRAALRDIAEYDEPLADHKLLDMAREALEGT